MRVVVDYDRCDSTGVCAATAPELFELDDDDVLQVRAAQLAPDQWSAAEEAARSCPKLAIALLDAG